MAGSVGKTFELAETLEGRRELKKSEISASQCSIDSDGLRLVDIETQKLWRLSQSTSITMGRYIGCDIVVDAPTVSGKHCTIIVSSMLSSEESRIDVLPLGTNGTFLNGEKIAQGIRQKLRIGDEIALASIEGPRFRLLDSRSKDPRETPEMKAPTARSIDGNLDLSQGALVDNNAVVEQTWQLVDDQTRDVYALADSAPLTLGSDGGCEIVVELEGVRSEHCRVVAREMKRRRLRRKTCENEVPAFSASLPDRTEIPLKSMVELRNLGSGQGTFVNGEVISSSTSIWLKGGDAITLGSKGGPTFLLEYGCQTPSEDKHPDNSNAMQKDVFASSCEVPRSKSVDCGASPTTHPGPKPIEEIAVCVAAALQNFSPGDRSLVDLASGMSHLLPEMGVVTIGRRADCDIVVSPASACVSGRHCVLLCQVSNEITLEDVSTNGTFINGTRVPQGAIVSQRIPLRHGDVISFAKNTQAFIFLVPSEQDGASHSEIEDE